MTKLVLPARSTVEGAETRLLMSECKGPSFPGYTLANATRTMQLMDLVLVNRFNNKPSQFGARGATSIVDIIRAKGQFHGFDHYPTILAGIVTNLQAMVDIANNPKDSRQSDFEDFIDAAVAVANTSSPVSDPSPNILAFWRTKGASSPGGAATFQVTVGGNDFYFLP